MSIPKRVAFFGLTKRVSAPLPRVDFSNDTRTNLVTAPQSSDVTTYPTRANVTGSTSLNLVGIKTGLVFGDNSLTRYAYKNVANVTLITYQLSVIVRMDDGAAPVVGVTTSTGDFGLIVDNDLVATAANIFYEILIAPVYRVTCRQTAVTGGANRGFGVVKYNTMTARTFTVSDYHVKVAS